MAMDHPGLYLLVIWKVAFGRWIFSGTKINLVIDGVKVSAEAIEHDYYDKTSYIKLPSALVNKVIRKAVINRWVDSGMLKKCTANNLPLIVMQRNDVNNATEIHFSCKNKPLKHTSPQ